MSRQSIEMFERNRTKKKPQKPSEASPAPESKDGTIDPPSLTAAAKDLSAEEMQEYYAKARNEFERLSLLHNQKVIESITLGREELDSMADVLGMMAYEARASLVTDIVSVFRSKATDVSADRISNLVVKLSRMGIHRL